MDQKIEAPTDEELTYIAKMWLLGSELATAIIDEELDGTKQDLSRLQRMLDTNQIEPESTTQLQALGVNFGKIFVNNNEDYDWWMVEDEFGRDVCIRYKETSLLAFPQTMLSKRIEDREQFQVDELYEDLVEQLEQIRAENYNDN